MKIQNLRFENLQFGYEGQDPVFENVDFDFPLQKIIWVKASTGAGRSTLLQLMAGLVMPTKGKYLLNDQSVTEMSFEEFLPYRLQIGYGFDFGGLLHNRTVLENLTLPLVYHKICGEKEAQDKAHYYLQELNALQFANKRPSEIPGGMRKLTCLIRAVITEPQILLLDDPSVGVGQDTFLKFFDLVGELRKKEKCQHIFISSFDDKLMNCIEHSEIFIDCGQIYGDLSEPEKKAVNL
jgi:ABC-type transporter Mla maintaining outer membrane lipid asymmetry ATPase subunit MlaF